MNKDVEALIRGAVRHGWREDGFTGGGHRRLVWPATGETVVMANTPGKPSGLHWARRDLERIGGALGERRGKGRTKAERVAATQRERTRARSTRAKQLLDRERLELPDPVDTAPAWKTDLAKYAGGDDG